MNINFKWGRFVGDQADKGKVEANIKELLLDPLVFTVPGDGIVNVSLYSGDPPSCKTLGVVSDGTKELLLLVSSSDIDNTAITLTPVELANKSSCPKVRK
jgi:hypothetical protein